MNVDAPHRRCIEDWLGKDESISSNNCKIGLKRLESQLFVAIAQALRRAHVDAQSMRAGVNCSVPVALSAS